MGFVIHWNESAMDLHVFFKWITNKLPNVVQLMSCVWLFVTPWTTAGQASLFFTISTSLLKLISIESMMASNHLIFCYPFSCPQSFPTSRSFPVSQLFASGGQSVTHNNEIKTFNFSLRFIGRNIKPKTCCSIILLI